MTGQMMEVVKLQMPIGHVDQAVKSRPELAPMEQQTNVHQTTWKGQLLVLKLELI